jgi:hypothetical protein
MVRTEYAASFRAGTATAVYQVRFPAKTEGETGVVVESQSAR